LNIYAIILACIQAVSLPLDKTCEAIPVYEVSFKSVPECLDYIDYFSKTFASANTDLYVTGFCTTKDINET